MQSQEYDKLFNEVLMKQIPRLPHDRFLQGFGNPMLADLRDMDVSEKQSLNTLEPEQARELIEKYEKPMPEAMQLKIKQYIDRRRKAKASEKAIRKAVKKKFGITVV
jgi:hypothetical protein